MENQKDVYGFRFRSWPVYQDARVFRKEIMLIVRKFPREEIYALIDQARRALNSILLNTAEGSNKITEKDKRVYINRALGSVNEIVACMDCALDDGYITTEEHTGVLK